MAWADGRVLGAVQARVERDHGDLLRRYGGGRPMAVARPRTADEKMVWRKLFDRNPLFTLVSDKLAVKAWAAARGVPSARVLWQGTDPAAIPPAVLAGEAVVKANHGWGLTLILSGGAVPRDEAMARGAAMLAQDHGRETGEWGYLGIPRTLFAEERLGTPDRPPGEMKVYTFGRRIERVVVIAGRFGEMAAARWHPDGQGGWVKDPTPTTVSPRLLDGPLPPVAPRVLEAARTLGAPFDHMRVDILFDGDRFWLGEMTVYNLGGHFPDCGADPDAPFARAWDLRRSWFLTARHADWRRRAYAAALRRELDRQDGGQTSSNLSNTTGRSSE